MERWWLVIVIITIAIVCVVVYAGPRGKIRRFSHEPWTITLGLLLVALAFALIWAGR